MIDRGSGARARAKFAGLDFGGVTTERTPSIVCALIPLEDIGEPFGRLVDGAGRGEHDCLRGAIHDVVLEIGTGDWLCQMSEGVDFASGLRATLGGDYFEGVQTVKDDASQRVGAVWVMRDGTIITRTRVPGAVNGRMEVFGSQIDTCVRATRFLAARLFAEYAPDADGEFGLDVALAHLGAVTLVADWNGGRVSAELSTPAELVQAEEVLFPVSLAGLVEGAVLSGRRVRENIERLYRIKTSAIAG